MDAIREMEILLRELGGDGGLVSPSIYDTAQTLRLFPAASDEAAVVPWLLGQQCSDGGWCAGMAPLARDLPTLAAVLALHRYRAQSGVPAAIDAGIGYLQSTAHQWSDLSRDDLPVGIELLLPNLLEEAVQCGLDLPRGPYDLLTQLGRKRRDLLRKLPSGSGTAAAHSWCAWGTAPDITVLDGSGGVGHSPAATAAWLALAENREDLAPQIRDAQDYLRRASAATQTGVSGVVPTVWPIDRFELVWTLGALVLAGCLDHPALGGTIGGLLSDLRKSFRPTGIGMSDFFAADADCTSTALAVFAVAGMESDVTVLQRFEDNGRYFTYPGELQESLTTNAHIATALALNGCDAGPLIDRLLDAQREDGTWNDKWHSSWLYATTQVLIALVAADRSAEVTRGIDSLLRHQRPEGAWGAGGRQTLAETSHAVLTLRFLQSRHPVHENADQALARGQQWLNAHYDPAHLRGELLWTGKEQYCPHRIDRALALCAIMP